LTAGATAIGRALAASTRRRLAGGLVGGASAERQRQSQDRAAQRTQGKTVHGNA
jgi:hypothetical protein